MLTSALSIRRYDSSIPENRSVTKAFTYNYIPQASIVWAPKVVLIVTSPSREDHAFRLRSRLCPATTECSHAARKWERQKEPSQLFTCLLKQSRSEARASFATDPSSIFHLPSTFTSTSVSSIFINRDVSSFHEV